MPSRPGPHVGCHVPFHAPGCPDWVADGESFPPRDYVFTLEVHVLAEDEEKARRRLGSLVRVGHAIKAVRFEELAGESSTDEKRNGDGG
jgi:hypothetical protein